MRDKYLRKYKKSKSDKDWELYKASRNYCNESLMREQKAYINSRLAHYKASLPKHLSDPDKINNYFSSVLSSSQSPSSKSFGKDSSFIVESYLQGRKQMVKVKDKVSLSAHITCGVPQGCWGRFCFVFIHRSFARVCVQFLVFCVSCVSPVIMPCQ
nr:unnamed protein product [Callosobruchus chinensis]